MTAKQQVTIRMYNVGFGDCFLLTIPTPDGVRRMLIDCGTHPASTGKHRAESDVVPLLLDDLKDEAGRLRLDVVAVSHRHKDHVSGFANELFKDVEVGEVWLPWTEDPDDTTATNLRDRMGIAASAMEDARNGITSDSPALAAATELMRNQELMLRNQASMDMLWTGFKGSPHHWYISATADPQTSPMLPGVTIHVLGPSRDEKTIRDLDPPPAETFAHLAAVAAGDGSAVIRPFDADWSISADEFVSYSAFGDLHVSATARERIRQLAADDLLAAAASLESSINGTSLVFVLDIGGLLLFFPGDAQWGTWDMILHDPKAVDLVKRSTFYKIGHHGSHNASPQSFVNTVMSPDTWAAVSVAPVKVWPLIPQGDLVTRMRDLPVHVLQSDDPPAKPPPNVTVRDDRSMDFTFDVPGHARRARSSRA